MANVFLNYTSEAMLHTNTTSEGKEFINVSIPCKASKTGYASFAVNCGQVLDAKRKDGSIVDGYKSILLGDADKVRKVSVATNKKGTNYKTIEMSNAAIVAEVAEARKAYRASQKEQAVDAE